MSKISFVIPTRNGLPYLTSAVKSVLAHGGRNCEVIVSVNRSEDDSLNMLYAINDSRLKVVVPPKILSMAENFEFAIANTSGTWISVFGDDDGIVWDFEKSFENLIQRFPKSDVFICRRAYCFWPGLESQFPGSGISYQSGAAIRKQRGHTLVTGAILGTTSFAELPHLYTGCIMKRSILERLQAAASGPIIRYCAPDVYTGIAIALLRPQIMRVEKPLFWIGTSPKSNGATASQIKTSEQVSKRVLTAFQADDESGRYPEFQRLAARRDFDLHGHQPWFVVLETSLVVTSGPVFCAASLLSNPDTLRQTHFLGRRPKLIAFFSLCHILREQKGRSDFSFGGEADSARRIAEYVGTSKTLIFSFSISLLVFGFFIRQYKRFVHRLRRREIAFTFRQTDLNVSIESANEALMNHSLQNRI